MDYDQVKKEIKNLREWLNYHNYRYYVLDDPEVSDAEYDRKLRMLQEIEHEHPELITDDSPTQRVGAQPLDSFEQHTHTVSMLSLDNAMEESELWAFDERIKRSLSIEKVEYICEPKLDGLAIELIYINGIFSLASTRGDGITGENVTQNVKTIKSIPLRLIESSVPLPEQLEVRGEVILEIRAFEKLNRERIEKGETPFANPRNAAAGSVRQLDSAITASRPLDFYCYAAGQVIGTSFSSQSEFLHNLKAWGIKVNKHNKICIGLNEVVTYFEHMKGKREELPYEIDGIVVKVNDFTLQERLGVRSRSPRWAIAYKFEAKQETTQIVDIVAQVGRTGALTPVAVMKPILVGGVEVSRATLHNQDEIDRKDIRIGDWVVVQRAGDVIPEVVKVLPSRRIGNEKPYTLPSSCPACGNPVIRLEGEAVHRCQNLRCPAQIKEHIFHFASRRAMDIDGLGEKIIDQLVQKGLVKDVSDLYFLNKGQLAELDRLANKSAENIIDAINASRKRSLDRLIYALGIRFVGEHIAKVLIEAFKNLDVLIAASQEDLIAIHEIGPQVARSVVQFFSQEENLKTLQRLKQAGVAFEVVTYKKADHLEGKTFVFTGALQSFTRTEAQRQVEEMGGRVVSSVSKNTSYIVVGDEPGSKADKAKKLGVTMLTEAEFNELINK